MGRHPRQLSETGYYHVVTRGNRCQVVFRQTVDYAAYCDLVHEAYAAHAVRLAHFCLMPNHTHLLAWAEELQPLSQAMHQLQRRYWFYVRRAYHLTGHLWQGRFHSFPIESEAYLLEAARYIERNPLEAKLVTRLQDYLWSSYRVYATDQLTPIPVTPTPMYEALGPAPIARQQAYRVFVETPQPYDRSMRQKLQRVTAYA